MSQVVNVGLKTSGENIPLREASPTVGTLTTVEGEKREVAVAGLPLVGDIFENLTKRVDASIQQAISSAKNAGLELEIEAGRQISLAIENAKNAYLDSMTKTMDKVDSVVQKHIQQLQSMVQDLESKTTESLERLEESAQQYLNTLPFATKQTQLTHVEPRYVAIEDKATTQVSFRGNFYYSATKGFEPTLSFPQKESDTPLNLSPISTTTQNLTFQVPTDIFKGSAGDPEKECSYVVGTLSAPWDNGWWSSHRVESNYKVYLGALPLSPGKITVEYVTTKEVTHTEPHSSETFRAWGDEHYPARWVEKKFVAYPASGYQIVSEPVIRRDPGAHGNHQENITRYDKDSVEVTVGLACYDGKHMGRISFHVDFTEEKKYTVIDTHGRTEEISLRWHDSVVVQPKENEKLGKVIFDSFDGHHQEFAGPNLDNPYLKIHAEGGGWRLEATVPKDIRTSMIKV